MHTYISIHKLSHNNGSYPAPSNLNYNYNFCVHALQNPTMLFACYYGTINKIKMRTYEQEADDIINIISKLILEDKKKPVNKFSKSKENYYMYNNKKIYLSKEMCDKVYNLILNLDSAKLDKSLDKSNKNYFNTLKHNIDNNYEFISANNPLFNYIDKDLFIKIFVKILSYETFNSYKVSKTLTIPISSISRNLGRILTYVILNEFYLKKLVKLKSETEKLEHMFMTYKELHSKDSTSLSQENLLLYLYLTRELVKKDKLTSNSKVKDIGILRGELSVLYLKIGTSIMSQIVSCKILNSQKNSSGIEMLLIENFNQTINLNSFFSIPYLTKKKPKVNSYTHFIDSNSFFSLDLNFNNIKENFFSTTHIKKNQYTNIFLHESSSVQYSIKEDLLNNFLTLLESGNNSNKEDNAFLNAMFKLLYDCNLDDLNITDKVLQNELILYGLNFNNIDHDKFLKDKCKKEVKLSTLYNKIISYKYTLRGFLVQAKIFSKFGFFYIPKYLTSTGRLYSESYLIQIQGLKLIKNFISYFNKDVLNTNNYKYLKNIFNFLPITYEEYKLKQKTLFLDYISSSLLSTSDISTYFIINDLKEQFLWIANNTVKNKNIWLVYTLLESYKSNDLEISYDMDSTSSSYQLIGLLCGDSSVLEMTNVLGSTARDIYLEILQEVLNSFEKYLITDPNYILINTFSKFVDRKTVKQCVMILGYSATVLGQKKAIKENLKEILINKSYTDYKDEDLDKFSFIAVNEINKICAVRLKGPLLALKSTKNKLRIKLKNKAEIEINMPYLKYTYAIYKNKKTKSRIYFKNRKIQFVVYRPTSFLNTKKMLSGFFPILIHGVDAFIVHDVYMYIFTVNKILKKNKLPLINLSTNHDCFSINMQYNVLLKYLVTLSYNKVKDLPITNDWFDQKEKLICTNTNFIKH